MTTASKSSSASPLPASFSRWRHDAPLVTSASACVRRSASSAGRASGNGSCRSRRSAANRSASSSVSASSATPWSASAIRQASPAVARRPFADGPHLGAVAFPAAPERLPRAHPDPAPRSSRRPARPATARAPAIARCGRASAASRSWRTAATSAVARNAAAAAGSSTTSVSSRSNRTAVVMPDTPWADPGWGSDPGGSPDPQLAEVHERVAGLPALEEAVDRRAQVDRRQLVGRHEPMAADGAVGRRRRSRGCGPRRRRGR